MIVKFIFESFVESLKTEPGRFALTWRIAVLCALMAAFAMLYQIPESAISCYLIIFLMKPDATLNMVLSVALTIIVCLVVGLLFVITDLTVNSGLLRMIGIFVSSYIFVYLGARFKSELGNLIALIIAFLLSMISIAPTGEIITRVLLYATLMATSPLLLMFLFNLFLGKRSQTLIIEKLRLRFDNMINFLSNPSEQNTQDFIQFINRSSADCVIHIKLIHIFKLLPQKQTFWLENAINQSFEMLTLLSIIPDVKSNDAYKILLENCHILQKGLKNSDCEKNSFDTLKKIESSDETLLTQMLLKAQNQFLSPKEAPTLPKITLKQKVEQLKAKKELQKKLPKPKLKTVTFHYFAIKVTIAAVTCYCIYNIFDWSGIHTAMITCYVVALSTTAETVHKLTLRICGCLLGAAMGAISIVYILPHLSHVGGLMILVFLCMLIPAWITAGSRLFSYAGVQIGLAFLLTTVHGFGPTVDLSIAQDRILGILLGNVVSYLVFTFLWPVSLSDQIENQIDQWLNLQLSSFNLNLPIPLKIEDAETLRDQTLQIDTSLKLTLFEQDHSKLDVHDHIQLRKILDNFNHINTLCLLPLSAPLFTQYRDELSVYLQEKAKLESKDSIAKLMQLTNSYLPLFQNELGKNINE